MALKKDIEQYNGVILSYHRITDIQNIVNDKTIINICSYINHKQREKEQEQIRNNQYINNIYKVASNVELEYNDTLTVEEAYKFLKTIDKYRNAEDE